jgi:hypothetical protein
LPSESYILPPKRHRWRAIGRVLFAIAWTLFAAEWFLRIFAQQPLMPRNVTASDFGTRVNVPNSVYRQRTPEVNVQVRINSQGIRADYDIPLEKPPGVKRIVVLGDSYGMGYEVDLKDAFTTQMANILQAAGHKVEIVNLSVSGYGNAEELLMLEHRGFAFHPDLVLLAWQGTDLDDNIRCGLYALRDGKLVRDQASYLPGVRTRQVLDRVPGYNWVEANSQLYSFAREMTAFRVKAMLLALRGSEEPAVTQEHSAPDGPAAAQPGTRAAPPPLSYPQLLTAALLKQVQDESKQHGAPLLMLNIPTWVSRTHFISLFPRAALDEAGRFDVVSPLDVFAQHRGEKLYWERGHYHFTVAGCRLVGELLARHILDEQLLGPRPRQAAGVCPSLSGRGPGPIPWMRRGLLVLDGSSVEAVRQDVLRSQALVLGLAAENGIIRDFVAH